MSSSNDLTERSKENWHARSDIPTEGELKLGCLQRIANATERIAPAAEAMSKRYADLERDNQQLREWNGRLHLQLDAANRSRAALRGQITKMKRKAAANG